LFLSKTINFYDKYWDKALKNSHELIGNISVVKIIDEIDSVELGWGIGCKWLYGRSCNSKCNRCKKYRMKQH
jgi:hypothetical protein